jgi:hypothetical protein
LSIGLWWVFLGFLYGFSRDDTDFDLVVFSFSFPLSAMSVCGSRTRRLLRWRVWSNGSGSRGYMGYIGIWEDGKVEFGRVGLFLFFLHDESYNACINNPLQPKSN